MSNIFVTVEVLSKDSFMLTERVNAVIAHWESSGYKLAQSDYFEYLKDEEDSYYRPLKVAKSGYHIRFEKIKNN